MKDLVPRIATYPIMSPGGLDYAEGHTYEIEQIGDPTGTRDRIGVLHRVRGDNLVSQLLTQHRADFACTLVSPWCAYRRVEKATGALEQTAEGIQVEQKIEVFSDQFSHPVMFQPSVVTNTAVDRLTAQASHGLDELWMGEEFKLPVAAMVAVQPFWNAKTTMQSILRLKKISDGSLKPGSFEVKEVLQQGFYFSVEVDEGLFKSLRNPESFEHRNSIYSMALSQGFDILHKGYKDREDWAEHLNLKLLYQMLKDKSMPTWEAEDFKPNQAAAAFHPHKVKLAEENELG